MGDNGDSGGGGGGGLSGLLSGLFGGGKASGGDIDAGTLYKVHKDEWIVPKSPGTVIPASGGPGGRSQQVVNNFHFNGVQDHDSFKKNQPQLAADMYGMMAAAHGRNR